MMVYFYSAEEDIDKVLSGSQKTLECRAGTCVAIEVDVLPLLMRFTLTGYQTMLLNGDVYSQVREAVLEKLGTHTKDLVEDIEIGPRLQPLLSLQDRLNGWGAMQSGHYGDPNYVFKLS